MMTFKELLEASGMPLTVFAAYFDIPYRTAQDWKADARRCPKYTLALINYKLHKENII